MKTRTRRAPSSVTPPGAGVLGAGARDGGAPRALVIRPVRGSITFRVPAPRPARPGPVPQGLPSTDPVVALGAGGEAPEVRRVVAAIPSLAVLERRYGPGGVQAAVRALVASDPALNKALGGLSRMRAGDWVQFTNAALVLGAFAYPPAPGLRAAQSRFSDGAHGVWYAASTPAAAQAEVGHHLAADLAGRSHPAVVLPRIVVGATLDPACVLVDLRGAAPPGVLDPASYAASQPFGAACAAAGQWGLLWTSVRRPPDLCVAVLRPPAVASAWIEAACAAHWDGRAVTWV